jgi:hypothetical protein
MLAPRGVFLAFSVNGAHWCAPVTRFFSVTRLKSAYLTLVLGNPGTRRVADYPVYYRSNTARQIERVARDFPRGEQGDVRCHWRYRLLRPAATVTDRANCRQVDTQDAQATHHHHYSRRALGRSVAYHAT